ncbi:hypothetical protein M422DRAFT_231697 [Sphaerobolus stellatus SS14]|uniref:HIT-type domain-containing protein n=1 Tax=Sphaerobolus stellatus (strain SS14) TaxID=990650 RepID=A0A0C9V742_SPHS4|nr:hypothetical protein M422DRAFT_231697 [Sphaerobolus stellatus SS14]
MNTIGRDIPCSICKQHQAIYTCPRCSTRTCSLTCSKSHKEVLSCSGERDKTAYVPMNKYGWDTMANDYAYLEEVGRKTTDWGVEIVKGGYLANTISARGRGRGRGGKVFQTIRGKRDFLKMQLAARDIDMEVLPAGMDRRRLNQSTCDKRTKSPLLTVEFIFHAPRYTIYSPSSAESSSYTLLTHRNGLSSNLLEILRRNTQNQKKDALPSWVQSLFGSFKDDESPSLVYLITQPSDTVHPTPATVHHKRHPTNSLLLNLRNITFVEYPTIEVWEEGDFTGAIVEVDGTFVEGEEPRPTKRLRLGNTGGTNNLLQGYSSSEDDNNGGKEANVLGMLGTYGSDEDAEEGKDENEASYDSDGSQSEDLEAVVEPKGDHIREIFDAVGEPLSIQEEADWSDNDEGRDAVWEDSGDEEQQLERALERVRTRTVGVQGEQPTPPPT